MPSGLHGAEFRRELKHEAAEAAFVAAELIERVRHGLPGARLGNGGSGDGVRFGFGTWVSNSLCRRLFFDSRDAVEAPVGIGDLLGEVDLDDADGAKFDMYSRAKSR